MSVGTTASDEANPSRDHGMIDLDDPRAADASVVGSKAASLAALRAAGENVPDGVVVLPGVDAAVAAQRLIARLGDVPLAVRSSSVAEDLARASYAGQYLTVLDVRGGPAIAEAIERVRRSAGDAESRGYGGERGAMAVLAMPLVLADAAGVAFTANPVTGDEEVVVEAVAGLGEQLVSGAATPQRFVVTRASCTEQPGPRAAITQEQAREIAELAERVATERGAAQDVEWAIAGGVLHLLQARPITALPVPIPIDVSPTETWIREDEHFGRPLRPLELDALGSRTDAASQIVFAEIGMPIETMRHRAIGGWPYVRMVPPMDSGRDSPKTPPALLFGLVVRLVPGLRTRLRRAAEVLATDEASRIAERWESRDRRDLRARYRALREVERARLTDAALADHLDEVLALLLEASVQHTRLASAMLIHSGQLGVLCEKVLGWSDTRSGDLVQGFSDATREAGCALDALAAAIESDEEARRLLEASPAALVAHPGSGGAALREYLDRYGHAIIGFDLAHPTYAEDPRPLCALVAHRIRRGPVAVRDLRAGAERVANEARETLADRPADLAAFERALAAARRSRPLGDESEADVLDALGLVRYVAVEAGTRLAARGALPDRDAALFLTTAELLAALRGAEVEADVGRRRGELRWAQAHPGPKRYGPEPAAFPSLRFVPAWSRPFLETMTWVMERASPSAVSPAADEPRDGLRGLAASPGVATGTVRIIRDPAEFERVEPGDVLVCPMTWAAWSVVFPLVSAVVTEHGGPLSHPAILAREFGIPAVLSVAAATTRLREGQVVTVDGAAGTLRVIATEE